MTGIRDSWRTKWLGSRIMQNRFSRNVLTLMGGTVVSQAILLLTFPFVAHLYSPEDVGMWQLFISISIVATVILTWRYELAIMLPDKEEYSANILLLTLTLGLAMSVIMLLLALGMQDRIVRLLGEPRLRPFVLAIPAITLLASIEQSCTYWLTRHGFFRVLAVSRTARALTLVGSQLLLAIAFGGRAAYLISGAIAAQMVATGTVAFYVVKLHGRDIARWGSWTEMKRGMKEYCRFPLYTCPYSFVGQFSQRAVLFLIGFYASKHAVGLYAMSMQIVYLPVTFISTALSQVFFPKMARELKTGGLDGFVLRILRLMMILVAPAMILLFFYGPDVFHLLLGKKWDGLASYTSRMAIPAFGYFLLQWLDRSFDILGRQRLSVVMQIGYDVGSIGLLWAALYTTLDPLFALTIYCGATVLYYVAWVIVVFRIAGFPLRGLSSAAKALVLVAGGTAAVHLLVRPVFSQPIAAAAVEITLIAACQMLLLRDEGTLGTKTLQSI